MRLNVLAQVVGAHEGLVADLAGELLLAGMDPIVPVELVRASELFTAEWEATGERFLASMPSQVSFQVRSFAILFATACVMTDVH